MGGGHKEAVFTPHKVSRRCAWPGYSWLERGRAPMGVWKNVPAVAEHHEEEGCRGSG